MLNSGKVLVGGFGMFELTFPIDREIDEARTDESAAQTSSIPFEILVIGTLLALIQVADGILTGIGVERFGSDVEGNLLIRHLIEAIGTFEALFLVKLVAMLVIVVLCRLAINIPWIKLALKGVIVIYTCAAIIPWTYILYTYSA
jgi:hypothetical protein